MLRRKMILVLQTRFSRARTFLGSVYRYLSATIEYFALLLKFLLGHSVQIYLSLPLDDRVYRARVLSLALQIWTVVGG